MWVYILLLFGYPYASRVTLTDIPLGAIRMQIRLFSAMYGSWFSTPQCSLMLLKLM